MGISGNFWDLLKPYARPHPIDFLRNKRVAVDLSFWIVQHDTAVRARSPHARSPHIRTTFFRTIALFSKMGVYPVFVVDGEPSALKGKERMRRFLKGVDGSALEVTEGELPVKRNRVFEKYVQECVELLELLGMPVLKARCEAEALCAQLNSEGHVDACITADSDAFLFGAKCVIKYFHANSKEPFECYYMSDIEAGLGLRRKQMVAIALLVGNDHDSHGVAGLGVDSAVRFVKLFTEDEILNRLTEIGKGFIPLLDDKIKSPVNLHASSSDEGLTTTKFPHCSYCGHPGSKRAHIKVACEYCTMKGPENCTKRPTGFRCECPSCDKDRKFNEQKKLENWQIKVCEKIAAEKNFPNKEIIDMYLSNNHGNYSEIECPSIRWDKPNVESLVDFLVYHQHWEPSYIRQRMLPMFSTIFFREMASSPEEGSLLCDQYEFHSIQREKIRNGHPYYLVRWKRVGYSTNNVTRSIHNEQSEFMQSESTEFTEPTDLLDEPDVPLISVDDGCWYLLTDENMELVQAAFPRAVETFMEEKRSKESKSKLKKGKAGDSSESPKSTSIQLSIKEFYRSTKAMAQAKLREDPNNREGQTEEKRKMSADSDHPLPKSVKRRLLFD